MATILFSSVVGSRVFGLDREGSDHDIRGVWVKSVDDLLNPFEAIQRPATSKGKEDVYHHELFHFLKLLGGQDLNAWQALLSRVGVHGEQARHHLALIALRYILNPTTMLSMAKNSGWKTMREALNKESGKIATIAMRNVIFAQNVASGYYVSAFRLWDYEAGMRHLLEEWDEHEAHDLFLEILGRDITPIENEYQGLQCAVQLREFYNLYAT